MNVDEVMSAAVEQAGSDDFGPDDFIEGLTVLCASANDEARLSELGEFAVQQNVIGGLVNRLRIHDWVGKHPEIRQERIESPLKVVGMFRAGTTFLSQLLDRDDAIGRCCGGRPQTAFLRRRRRPIGRARGSTPPTRRSRCSNR